MALSESFKDMCAVAPLSAQPASQRSKLTQEIHGSPVGAAELLDRFGTKVRLVFIPTKALVFSAKCIPPP
jgi:hypothetical protein